MLHAGAANKPPRGQPTGTVPPLPSTPSAVCVIPPEKHAHAPGLVLAGPCCNEVVCDGKGRRHKKPQAAPAALLYLWQRPGALIHPDSSTQLRAVIPLHSTPQHTTAREREIQCMLTCLPQQHGAQITPAAAAARSEHPSTPLRARVCVSECMCQSSTLRVSQQLSHSHHPPFPLRLYHLCPPSTPPPLYTLPSPLVPPRTPPHTPDPPPTPPPARPPSLLG